MFIKNINIRLQCQFSFICLVVIEIKNTFYIFSSAMSHVLHNTEKFGDLLVAACLAAYLVLQAGEAGQPQHLQPQSPWSQSPHASTNRMMTDINSPGWTLLWF